MFQRSIRLISITVLIFFSLIGIFQPLSVNAAPGVVVSGKVINQTTGQPLAGIVINTCTGASPMTDTNGHWQLLLGVGTNYCARIGGGVPSGLSAPIASGNNPEHSASASYESQLSGMDCYRNAACASDMQTWDKPADGGLNFVFTNIPVAPVKPIVSPSAPPPAPSISPAPAPTPAPSVTPTPSVTPATVASKPPLSIASEDGLATAKIETSNLPDQAICRVNKTNIQSGSSGKKVVAGNYIVSCTSSTGEKLDLKSKKSEWSIKLEGQMNGLVNPEASGLLDSKRIQFIDKYDKKAQVISFSAPIGAEVYVEASSPSYTWINAIIVIGALLGVVAFVLYFPLRAHRRRSYHDYLRSKYYNL